MLINAIKDVAKALSDLIGATKGAASKPADDPSMYQLKGAAKVRGKKCSPLLSLSQVAHRSFGLLSQILLLPPFPELANNCRQLFKARGWSLQIFSTLELRFLLGGIVLFASLANNSGVLRLSSARVLFF